MRTKANDGSMQPSQMAAHQQNQAAPSDSSQSDQQPQSIENDPHAMQLVDELKQMGYTADDVAQAMQDDGGQDQSQGGQPATQAAPLQIPGMQ